MRIPSTCDALVIGAGPAGTAAAQVLARAGLQVVLADQRPFPRDKVCGDGLIGDALGAFETLGLRARLAGELLHAQELRVYAPNGRHISVKGNFACLPRERLDALLLDAATDAGAQFVPSLAAVAALETGGRVAGARFRRREGTLEIRAPITLLATGANATIQHAFGLQVPAQPDGVAGRAYFEAPPDVAARFPYLTIAYDRDWCPGYGWIFPSPGNRFNIGVGLFPGRRDTRLLRRFWDAFRTRFEPAAAIAGASIQLTEFRGAPLRMGLAVTQFGRPGLVLIGEAAAATYSATGEGIGKALESGLIAAGLVVAGLKAGSAETLHEAFADEFRRRFSSRYDAYRVAQAWASRPLMLNLLAARAASGRFVRSELEALVAETGDAHALFSMRGLLTALVR